MDSLLRRLQALSIGASVNNMYAGGFVHADDIRTLAPNTSTLEVQISFVKIFTEENFLKLNPLKCEIVAFNRAKEPADTGEVGVNECCFPVRETATCLGYQWKYDLSSLHAIQFHVQKACRAFIHLVVFMHFKEI